MPYQKSSILFTPGQYGLPRDKPYEGGAEFPEKNLPQSPAAQPCRLGESMLY